MKNVLEYLENVKTNNLVIDKNGSISYQKLLENSKKITEKERVEARYQRFRSM